MNLIFKWVDNQNDMDLCYKLRNEVFTLEQHFDEEIDRDEYDEVSNHILILDNELPIATARILLNQDYYKVGRFCVIKSYRKKNIGFKMMEEILSFIRKTDIKLVKLSAQYHAYKFYEICGFKTVGDIYLEEGAEHILMVYNIYNLQDCREKLDKIDQEIMNLFTLRMNVVKQVGLYKKVNNIDVLDSTREQEIIDTLINKIDPEFKVYYKELIKTFLKVSKDYQLDIINHG